MAMTINACRECGEMVAGPVTICSACQRKRRAKLIPYATSDESPFAEPWTPERASEAVKTHMGAHLEATRLPPLTSHQCPHCDAIYSTRAADQHCPFCKGLPIDIAAHTERMLALGRGEGAPVNIPRWSDGANDIDLNIDVNTFTGKGPEVLHVGGVPALEKRVAELEEGQAIREPLLYVCQLCDNTWLGTADHDQCQICGAWDDEDGDCIAYSLEEMLERIEFSELHAEKLSKRVAALEARIFPVKIVQTGYGFEAKQTGAPDA